MFLLVCTAAAGFRQAMAAKSQAETAERGLMIAERATSAAENQLLDARVATSGAQQEREAANQRAAVSDERAKLAHEQMRASLAPLLVLLRIQDRMGQKFFIENQGQGSAQDITWDYQSPTVAALGERLLNPFSANMLAPNAREEFFLNYDSFTKFGMMFRYLSRDGRVFWSHITLLSNGAFGHTHIPPTE